MASFARDNAAAKLEGYEPLDLHESGDVCFTLQTHDTGPEPLEASRAMVMEEVLRSPRLANAVKEVSKESSREMKEVQAEVKALVEEIAHNMAMPAVRTLAFALRNALRRILHGVYVNTAGLEKLRELSQERAIVLLPSHRSYLDFILITFIMFNFNMKLPCIAAGQDFMNMKGVTGFLRRSGAFFLRRTFGSEKLYKTVFSVYVQTLLCRGVLPMEFFIEGTRSRTAKSLHPKLGLLSMVVEPFLGGRLSDIHLVPISISYERTLEEELFARELLGVPKPKESTGALLKARSILTEDYGSIYATIGDPISLHDFCASRGVSRVPHTMYPKDLSVMLSHERDVVLKLGHVILDRIHHGMRIFPSSLVATVMLQCRGGILVTELVRRVELLRDEVVARGGTVHWITDSRSVVESALKMLGVAVAVDSGRGLVTVRTEPMQARQHPVATSIQGVRPTSLLPTLFESIKQEAFTPLILAHYRNQLLHLFVVEGLVALSLRTNMQTGEHYTTPISRTVALRRFEGLHCALACEFVLPITPPSQMFEDCLQAFLDRGLLQGSSAQEVAVTAQGEEQLLLYGDMILPFVVGNWVVCEHLLSIGDGVETISGTIKGAQQLAAKCLHTGLIDTHEPLSLGIVKNCLASLTQCSLILQPISEFSTGRDRLVKVGNRGKLTALSSTLGLVIFPLDSAHSKL